MNIEKYFKVVFTVIYLSITSLLCSGQDVAISDEILFSGEYQNVFKTECTEPIIKDNVIKFLTLKKISNKDDVQNLNNSLVASISIGMGGKESEINHYVVGVLIVEFKDTRVRIRLEDLKIYESYLHYDSFNKYISLNKFCFIDNEQYIIDKKSYLDKISYYKDILNSKASKKEKKEADYQLGIANAELKRLEASYNYDKLYGKAQNKKETLDTINSFIKQLLQKINTCDNW